MSVEKLPARRALGDAVQAGVIANETLAYFIGRTYLFMERIGVNTEVVVGEVEALTPCSWQGQGHSRGQSLCTLAD